MNIEIAVAFVASLTVATLPYLLMLYAQVQRYVKNENSSNR